MTAARALRALLWSGRRKCLLLTHAATLFSVFEADVRAVDLRATHRLVTELVEWELRREGCRLQRSAACAHRS